LKTTRRRGDEAERESNKDQFAFCHMRLQEFLAIFLVNAALAVQIKRRDVLTPQLRHWYAFNGTLSGTPDQGVPRTVSVA
jgi:hypothetical protein